MKLSPAETKYPFHLPSLVCCVNYVRKNIVYASDISTVLDENDNAPDFDESTYIFEVNENTDFILFQVSASDSDIGTNREVRYGIVDGNTEQTFLISKYLELPNFDDWRRR